MARVSNTTTRFGQWVGSILDWRLTGSRLVREREGGGGDLDGSWEARESLNFFLPHLHLPCSCSLSDPVIAHVRGKGVPVHAFSV